MAIWIKKLKNKKLYKFFAPQVHLIDIKNLFKDKSLEGAMRELGETARVYKGQPDLEKEGYYIAEDDGLDNAEDNNVVGVLKEYFNNSFSNPNLLINSNFRNLINQRRLTEYSISNTSQYTVDRWNAWAGGSDNTMKLSIVENGLKYENVSANSMGNRIRQAIEMKGLEPNSKITLSIKASQLHGNFYIAIAKGNTISSYGEDTNIIWLHQEVIQEDGICSFTVDIGEINRDFLIVDLSSSLTGSSIVIDWIKLEVGDKATPFIPRPYSEELALCQRYYLGGEIVGQCYAVQTNSMRFSFPTPVTMRTVPTLIDTSLHFTSSDSGKIILFSNGLQNQSDFTFSNINLKKNAITIQANKNSHGLTGFPEMAILVGNGFDAEIY